MSAQEQARLRRFAYDLPGLWVIRCLVAQVVVCVPEEHSPLNADVHWVGGEVTCIQVPKGRTSGHRYVTEAEVVELVRRLAEEFSNEQIARILHSRRLKTSKGFQREARDQSALYPSDPGIYPRCPGRGPRLYRGTRG